jgi:hypothetical protein
MRNQIRVLAVIVSMLLAGGLAAAPAGAAGAPGPVVAATSGKVAPNEARFGGRGFGRPRGLTPRQRYAQGRRNPAGARPFRGLGGGILRALGIAYLVHLLFGWGAGGGSPFGLLIVLGLVALIVARARRRRSPAYRY